MNHEKTDKTIKENRIKVMDSGRKKKGGLTSCSDSFLLSCSVVSLSSAVPKRDSVFSTIQKNNMFFFFLWQKLFLSRNFTWQSEEKNKTFSTGTLFWPGGMGVPGCVATGLAGTGVLGSEDKLSVSFFNSMPMGIRSGELSFPFTCSNSCTYIKEIRPTVIQLKKNPTLSWWLAFLK